MAWRLHLSDRTIKRLDILSGKPNVLAAWTQDNRVSFSTCKPGRSAASAASSRRAATTAAATAGVSSSIR
ncbi:MAG: hypothetical protein U0521_20620 [Anaerolineae bacterium]